MVLYRLRMRNRYIRLTTTALIILSLGWIVPAACCSGVGARVPDDIRSGVWPVIRRDVADQHRPFGRNHQGRNREETTSRRRRHRRRKGKVVCGALYGNRAVEPSPEPMTVDTIFDLASLTKVVATATSMMILVERGLVRLGDPVSRTSPNPASRGRTSPSSNFDSPVRIDRRQRHQGSRAGAWGGDAERLETCAAGRSRIEIYLFRRQLHCSGRTGKARERQTRHQFAAENVFVRARDERHRLQPDASLTPRIAPTEKRGEKWMRGEVHDPRAYLLGGVAGHAGLFSTADDLASYCQMILNRGEFHGARVSSPMGMARMTEARPTAETPSRARRAASGGTSSPAIRPIEATCFLSAVSATPASRARVCGSTRRAKPSSFS